MSALSLDKFLVKNAVKKHDGVYNNKSGRKISACVPMHTYGLPCRIKDIQTVCAKWNIPLIEDAAESLGSYVDGRHTGTFGELSIVSFNGNKIITTGGGGMILTNNEELARSAKHITTTAKISHAYEFVHDQVGYNYRMPNLNAALGCAQLESLEKFITVKQRIHAQYQDFFAGSEIQLVSALENSKSNCWLNAILLNSKSDRDELMRVTNEQGVMTRPLWKSMNRLPMFSDCQTDGLENSAWLEDRILALPSSVP